MDEIKLLEPVGEYLGQEGYTVYHEVPVTTNGDTYPVDMIGVRGDQVVAVEGKMQLDPKLVEQCLRWSKIATQTIAVIPEPKKKSPQHLHRRELLMNWGVGIYYIKESGRIHFSLSPISNTLNDTRDLLEAITEAQQEGPPAGSRGVKRMRADKWDVVRAWLKVNGQQSMGQLRAHFQDITHQEWLDFSNQARKGNLYHIGYDKTNICYPYVFTGGES